MKVNDVTNALQNKSKNTAETVKPMKQVAVDDPAYVVKLEKNNNVGPVNSKNKEKSRYTIINERCYSSVSSSVKINQNTDETDIVMSDNSSNIDSMQKIEKDITYKTVPQLLGADIIDKEKIFIDDNKCGYAEPFIDIANTSNTTAVQLEDNSEKKSVVMGSENDKKHENKVVDFTAKRQHIKFLQGQLQQIGRELQMMSNELQDDSKEIMLRNMQSRIKNIQQQINNTMADIMNSIK